MTSGRARTENASSIAGWPKCSMPDSGVSALYSERPRFALPDRLARQGSLLFIWLLLLLFVVYPLAMLLQRAVFDNGALSLGTLSAALKSSSNFRALRNSLELAALVGIAGTAVGFVFAFTVERVRLGAGLRWLVDRSTFLPLISPPFTTSIAIVFSFGPRGLITYDLLGLQDVKVYGLAS